MFKALLRRQFLELRSLAVRSRVTGRQRGRVGKAVFLLLTLLLAAILLLSFSAVAVPLCMVLEPLGLGWLYFAAMELMALLLGTVAGAFVSHSTLFEAKDNELLLSLPIPPAKILASRLLSLYVDGIVYIALVMVPTHAVWLHLSSARRVVVLSAVPVVLALGCVAAALACLLGWGVAAASSRSRHKSLITAVSTGVLMLVYLAGYNRLQSGLSALLTGAAQIAPDFKDRAGVLYWLGSAACGNVPALAGLIAFGAGTAALLCAVLSRRYTALMTARPAAPKAEYREKPRRRLSVRTALLVRELKRFVSCTPYLINGAVGWVAMPLAGAAVLWKRGALCEVLALLPPALVLPAVCAAVCAAAGSSPVAAPSVSLEGGTLWLLQSLPVEPRLVLRAKCELHMLMTAPPALICMVCAALACGFTAAQTAAALFEVAVFTAANARLELVFGLLVPNLHWTSEAAVVKQSLATALSLMSGWAAALALGALGAFLSAKLSPAGAAVLCGVLLLCAAAGMEAWLRGRGAAIFAGLQ